MGFREYGWHTRIEVGALKGWLVLNCQRCRIAPSLVVVIITSAKEVMFSPVFIYLFVCLSFLLSVCLSVSKIMSKLPHEFPRYFCLRLTLSHGRTL